jgi:hypothetical protein
MTRLQLIIALSLAYIVALTAGRAPRSFPLA